MSDALAAADGLFAWALVDLATPASGLKVSVSVVRFRPWAPMPQSWLSRASHPSHRFGASLLPPAIGLLLAGAGGGRQPGASAPLNPRFRKDKAVKARLLTHGARIPAP